MGLYGSIATDASSASTLTYLNDLVFTADLDLGSTSTYTTPVVFDTASDKLMVDLDGNTPGGYSAGSASTDQSYPNYTLNNFDFTSTTDGTVDQVCFDTYCTSSGSVSIYTGTAGITSDKPFALTDVSGFCGLTLGKGAGPDGTIPAYSDMLVTQFSDQKFAFNIGSNANQSYIDLGVETSDTSLMKTGSGYETKTFDVTHGSYYWEADLMGARFSTDGSDEWGLSNNKVRFASGRPCIYAPSSQYTLMKSSVMKYSFGYYESSTYGLVTSCDMVDHMPNLQFHVGGSTDGFWTQVRVQDYLIEIDNSYECMVCLRDTGVDDNNWYFGTTWFAGYYVQFDRDANQMSMTQA